MDLISVIVPVYNVEKYLQRSVTSLLNQTYKNLEIILVDDGTKDNSGKMCDEFASQHKNIKVVHKTNGGLSSARNAGIKVATGKYIGFIDSDDYVEPTLYENLYNSIKGKNRVIALTDVKTVKENGEVISVHSHDEEKYTKEQYLSDLLMFVGEVSAWSKLFPREIFDNHSFDETKLNEDLLFMFDIENEFDEVCLTKSADYNYVMHEGSISRSFGKSIHDMIGNAKVVRDIVDAKYPELKEKAERFEIFQNYSFLWCVPKHYKRKEDKLVKQTYRFLRHNYFKALKNKYLTKYDKTKITLAILFPHLLPYLRK